MKLAVFQKGPNPDRRPWGNVSASQVKKADRCARRWFYGSVWGWKEPKTDSLILGNAVHAFLETHVADGTPLPTTYAEAEPILLLTGDPLPSRAIVEKAIRFAPKVLPIIDPVRPRVSAVERKLEGFKVAGVPWFGFVDLELDGPFAVWDYKTTSNPKYSLGPDDLALDVQMLSYSVERMLSLGIDRVPVRHIYIPTKHENAPAFVVDAVVTLAEVETRWPQIEALVLKMKAWAEGDDPEAVPQNDKACFDYGKPCPFRDRCFPTSSKEVMTVSSMLEMIKARKAAAEAAAATTPAAAAPVQAAPAPTPAAVPAAAVIPVVTPPPAATPTPAAGSMLALIAARKAAASTAAAVAAAPTPPQGSTAAMVAALATPNPALAPTPTPEGATYNPVPCAAMGCAAPARSNSDLCPGCEDASRVSPPDAAAPGAPIHKPASIGAGVVAAAPAEAAGRIRRTKAEIAAGIPVEEVPEFREAGCTPEEWIAVKAELAATAPVAAAPAVQAPIPAAPVAAPIPAPIAAPTPVQAPAPAAVTAAPVAAGSFWPPRGLILMIDAIPLAPSFEARRLETYLAEHEKAIAENTGAADYRLVDYGKGAGYLAALIRESPPAPGIWCVSSYGPTAKIAIETLIPLADLVIKGV